MKINADIKRKRFKMKRISLFIGALLITGCAANTPTAYHTFTKIPPKKISNESCVIDNTPVMKKNNNCIIVLEAKGEGVSPCSGTCNMAQSLVLARRAAILDAYRNLAAKMYGIKINGKDSVQNMILQNSELNAYVTGLIRGANIEKEEFKNGIYTVVMSVKLDVQKWNKYLNNH